MLRSQQIPVKYVTGYVPVQSVPAYHAWNEIYTVETGWIKINNEAFFGGGSWGRMDSTLAAGNRNGKDTEYMKDDRNYIKDREY
jgi:hypothetical protein